MSVITTVVFALVLPLKGKNFRLDFKNKRERKIKDIYKKINVLMVTMQGNVLINLIVVIISQCVYKYIIYIK